ncbi:type VI secretion system tube protein Hcp [Vibrio sp. S4M6]|uniref:Hcp family type VI secretion system effector n=1 Tax=Vibrio sinus TaxID=2946865 RepID=UPI002029F23C|nr:type VI secretion system tube protein Hcp [Vibrio sinus]MCL9783149.1 type VI secretion system tube protein Hcp [Vibrio sinus]
MAGLYMTIDGYTPKGAATVEDIGGKKNLIAIDSLSWSAVRGVGIDVGNANNADQGMVALGEINFSRGADGASPYLTTFLYSPGDTGKKVEFVVSKPDRGGKGMVPVMLITLTEARVSSYNMGCNDGSLPSESVSLVYSTITKAYYYEDEGGKITKGPEVAFDVPKGQATSLAS